MIYSRHINVYRQSDSNLVVELPHESIDLPYRMVDRDDEMFASLDDAVLSDLFSRDDVSVSREERSELECYFCRVAEQQD